MDGIAPRAWPASSGHERNPGDCALDDHAIARAQASLVAAIGGPCFPRRLLDALKALAGVELCSVFLSRCKERVELIFANGEHPLSSGFPFRASHDYARVFWRSDRQMLRLARSISERPAVIRRRAMDITDPAYRAACYDRGGVAERISIVSPGFPRLVINGYRTARSAPFSPHDGERLELHADLLIAALRQHLRAAAAALSQFDDVTLAARLATLECGLSAREAEVAAALILGQTQDRIARVMGLSTATVVTYRRRAYGKLGVGNRRELMALHRRLASDAGRIWLDMDDAR